MNKESIISHTVEYNPSINKEWGDDASYDTGEFWTHYSMGKQLDTNVTSGTIAFMQNVHIC